MWFLQFSSLKQYFIFSVILCDGIGFFGWTLMVANLEVCTALKWESMLVLSVEFLSLTEILLLGLCIASKLQLCFCENWCLIYRVWQCIARFVGPYVSWFIGRQRSLHKLWSRVTGRLDISLLQMEDNCIVKLNEQYLFSVLFEQSLILT